MKTNSVANLTLHCIAGCIIRMSPSQPESLWSTSLFYHEERLEFCQRQGPRTQYAYHLYRETDCRGVSGQVSVGHFLHSGANDSGSTV
jgi:hypothetical protein